MADATFNIYVESPVASFADLNIKKFFPQSITF